MIKAGFFSFLFFLTEHTTSKNLSHPVKYSSSESQDMHSCPLVDSFVEKISLEEEMRTKWDHSEWRDKGVMVKIALICDFHTVQPRPLWLLLHLPLPVWAEGRQCHQQLPDTDRHLALFPLSGKVKQKDPNSCIQIKMTYLDRGDKVRMQIWW